mmetsp:Transcript_4538/g.11426  ORF Transcript_4538/g.11426 Transcript_4538/m.11426 type:complete len:392 (+) Transcript_4538:129-1304(+)
MNGPLPEKLTASVCCMVGLPGSGKSTVVKRIIDLHEQECCTRTWPSCADIKNDHHSNDAPVIKLFDKILVIDYDSITQQELASCNDKNGKDANLEPRNTLFDSNELDAWRKVRIIALNNLKDVLSAHFAGDGSASSLLILMDDNFHLRSMRRDIYRSCQDILATTLLLPANNYHSQPLIGFSTVYLSTPTEVCLQRNNSRNGKERIPPEVINRMASVIEPPDETKPYGSFECFHISIDNSKHNIITKESKILHEIDKCLQKSLLSPILPRDEICPEEIFQLEQQRIRQREETLKCQVQRIDQLLRKLVGAVGRVDKKKSKEANDTRKSMMEKIRKRDDSMINDTSDDSVSRHFVCLILGTETSSKWHQLDNPLVRSIKDVLREFQEDRGKV